MVYRQTPGKILTRGTTNSSIPGKFTMYLSYMMFHDSLGNILHTLGKLKEDSQDITGPEASVKVPNEPRFPNLDRWNLLVKFISWPGLEPVEGEFPFSFKGNLYGILTGEIALFPKTCKES